MRLNCQPLGLCLLVLLMMLLFLWLGAWQVDRSQEKARVIEQSQSQSAKEVEVLPLNLQDYESLRYLPVKASGEYDIQHQFLHDNQVKNHKVGYSVLTPLKIAESSKAVLVDRGWIAQGLTRQLRPDINFQQNDAVIKGSLYTPFGEGVRIGGLDDGEIVWPRVIQFLDFEAISDRLGYDLLPVVIRLSPSEENGYLREWKTVSFSPEKHLGYAVQWYGLAAAMAVILLILAFKRNKE